MYLVLQLINVIDNSFLNGFESFIFRMARAVKGLCTICIATQLRGTRVFANIIAPVRYASFFTRADLDRI